MTDCRICCVTDAEHVWNNEVGEEIALCGDCFSGMAQKSTHTLRVRRLRDEAKLPTYSTDGSGGLDLYSCSPRPVSVHFGDKPTEIPLGIAVEIPKGYVGLIKGRSGMAFKAGVTCFNGVIDSDYRGELKALLSNRGDLSRTYTQGDRVCQLVIVKCERFDVVEDDKLEHTERNKRGFGSSGR